MAGIVHVLVTVLTVGATGGVNTSPAAVVVVDVPLKPFSAVCVTVPAAVTVTVSVIVADVVAASAQPPATTSTARRVTVATPERASVAENVTVTSDLFQPFAFGAGTMAVTKLGGVLSILIPDTVAA